MVCEEALHPEAAPGDLQIGEPGPLGVPGDLKNLRAELLGIQGRDGVPADPLEQLRHSVQLQRRAKPAGKHLPVADEGDHIPVIQSPLLQVFFQNAVVAQGGALLPVRGGEVHTAAAEPAVELLQQRGPVCTRQIHLVDEQEGWDVVTGQQPPQGGGMPPGRRPCR